VASLALAAGAATSASAEQSIEGIWSFDGGRVGIVEQPDGKLLGTVVAPTKFADCTHEIGEPMWTSIEPQPDGSYRGFHRWYIRPGGECVPDPAPGPTAWRMLETDAGSRFLRVCFSDPRSGLQPTIAPDGEAADTTFGCVDSDLIASLPEGGIVGYIPGLGAARDSGRQKVSGGGSSCISRNRLRFRIRNPKNDPIRTLRIVLRLGPIRKVARVRRRGRNLIAVLLLTDLPSEARFAVRFRVRTTLGRRFSLKRTYARCAGGKRPSGKKNG
jgi:hypothetical protein